MSSPSSSTSSPKNKYPQWHNLAAGAAAGAGARLLTAPLDLLKIRSQLHSQSASSATSTSIKSTVSQIIKNEGGFKGLFRGNVAATYLWIGYAAVQFSLYARTSNLLASFGTSNANSAQPNSPLVTPPISSNQVHPPVLFQNLLSNIGSNPTATAFCSGATAGVAATLITYPFDICRTIFAAKGISSSAPISGTKEISNLVQKGQLPAPPKSLYQFAQSMHSRNGIRGFFVGSVPAVIQIIPYMGINFALYDYLVRIGTEKGKKGGNKVNAGGAGMAGFIAGGKLR